MNKTDEHIYPHGIYILVGETKNKNISHDHKHYDKNKSELCDKKE